MPDCKICQRKNEAGEFCDYHELAKKNIDSNYKYWKEAYGEISLEEYLKILSEHSSSGKWVKEVAIYLLNNKK